MELYEILEHRGDFKIKVLGKTKEELFLNAMKGMIAGMRPKNTKQKTQNKKIKIESSDLNALLVDFLSEVLYQIQTNREIYNDVKFKKFSDTHSTSSGQAELEAELIGQKVESFGEDIKAVTYHGLDIRQRGDGLFEAIVLFDI